MDGDVYLGRPTPVRARAQPVADHLLEPADRRLRISLDHGGSNALLIVRAVGGEGRHRSGYLIEQGPDLGTVVGLLCGERRRDDLASVGTQADV